MKLSGPRREENLTKNCVTTTRKCMLTREDRLMWSLWTTYIDVVCTGWLAQVHRRP
jgi:hypothetical protein